MEHSINYVNQSMPMRRPNDKALMIRSCPGLFSSDVYLYEIVLRMVCGMKEYNAELEI